jgi:DNA-binding CsgD family transcriptional regulator
VPPWAVPPLPARLAVSRDDVFVGRDAELRELERVWSLVEAGTRQAVFVSGEAGSGKSRLAARIAAALHGEDAVVLLGSSSPDLGYPYEPFVEALDHLLLTTQPGDLAELIPDAARPLTRITPLMSRHRGDLTPVDEPGTEYRRELFEAYRSLMDAGAAEHPVVLLLEDLQWATAPTRLLLSHLVEATTPAQTLIVGTLRDTAPDRSDELALFLADAYRSSNVHLINLRGLTTDDIMAYLLAEGDVDRARARRAAEPLERQTAGNPFFLRELCRDLRQRGGYEALERGDVASPRTVRDALAARLSSLDPTERRCLELAAVAGETFEIGDLAAAGGYDRPTVLEAIDRATAFGLITYDTASGTCEFQHALVRQALLDGLSPSRSAHHHATVAEAIASRAAHPPAVAALLARLYDGAQALGYANERIQYLTEAATHAQHSLAHEEAAELWERAARIVSSDGTKHDVWLLAAAGSHLLAGDFAEARRVYREVAASSDGRAALCGAIGFEDASWRPGLDGGEASDLLDAALRRIERDPADPLYVRALAARSRAHAFLGELDDAGRLGSRALALARDLADDALVAHALSCNLHIMMTPDILAVQHHRAIELRAIALATGDYDELAAAGTTRAVTSYISGHVEGWYAGLGDVRRAAATTGQPFWAWVVGCYEYCERFMAGDFAAAGATAARIRDLGDRFGSDDTDGPYGLQMYLVQRETGQLERIRPLLSGNPVNEGRTWVPGLLALYIDLGMDEAGTRLLRIMMQGFDRSQLETASWPAVLAFLARAAVHLADAAALDLVEPLLDEYEGCNLVLGHSVAVLGSANLLLADVHAVRGDMVGAASHYEKALAMNDRMGSVVHVAETLARYAILLDERDEPGDPHRAAEHRTRARALAEPRGHQRVLAMLTPRRDATELPDGLTARELDVLQLLGEGASNKEIGTRLAISQNTAANHVRSILIKTGTANRTQAAIYAAERGLLTTGPPAT